MQSYEIIRPIGKGSFGKVYLVKHRTERKQYCLKTIKLDGIPPSERKACQTEVKLLEKMMHPNIVGFKESFIARNGKLLCIVMTYCDGGDLAERLKAQEQKRKLLKEEQILHWFVQLGLGLHFMHEMNDKCILHRDLKTQNVFLLGNGRLVIGDLGISKALDTSTDFTKTTIGTPYYMSPEVYKSRPYNHKSDVWALGCVLYEMITLKHAFNAKSLDGLMGKVVKGKYTPIPAMFSRNLAQLVDSMLSLNPASRPSLPEILSLPFIKRHIYRFLRDIADRPTSSIGEGTMVLKHAVLGAAGSHVSASGVDRLLEKQTKSLKKQLESLGMRDIVQQAFHPSSPSSALSPMNYQQNGGDSSAMNRAGQRDLHKEAKEQRNALVLERERKRAVEAALEKLRRERLLRANERKERLERMRRREAYAVKRREQLRREEEEKKKKAVALAQRRAAERARDYNNVPRSTPTRTKPQRSPVARYRQDKGSERKVREPTSPSLGLSVQPAVILPKPAANKGYRSPRTPPESPPPPPPLSHRERVLAMKIERQRDSERQQRDRLMKAAQERMVELKNASEMNRNQFHTPSTDAARMQDKPRYGIREDARVEKQPVDYDTSSEHSEDDKEEEGVQEVQLSRNNQVWDSEEQAFTDEEESDHSSVPEAMEELDSQDDDLDEKEQELKQELAAATLRCSTIKQSLKQVKAVLHTHKQANQQLEQAVHVEENSPYQTSEDESENDSDQAELKTNPTTQKVSEPREKKPQHAKWSMWKEEEEGEGEDVDSEDDGSSSSESSEDGLFSPVLEGGSGFGAAHRGGLKSRIQHLEEECVRALGRKRFDQVYQILKQSLEQKLNGNKSSPSVVSSASQSDKALHKQLHALLARDGKLAYWNKIDNLIFMQEAI